MIQYSLHNKINLTNYECIVLGFFTDTNFRSILQSNDQAILATIDKLRTRCIASGDWILDISFNDTSLLVFNCGDNATFNHCLLNKYLSEIVQIVLKQKIKTLQIYLPQIANASPDWQLKQMVSQIETQCYAPDGFKTKNKRTIFLQTSDLCVPNASSGSSTTPSN